LLVDSFDSFNNSIKISEELTGKISTQLTDHFNNLFSTNLQIAKEFFGCLTMMDLMNWSYKVVDLNVNSNVDKLYQIQNQILRSNNKLLEAKH
jgi:hypothetical protein